MGCVPDAHGDEAEAALGVEEGLFAIGGAASILRHRNGRRRAGVVELIFI